MVICFISLSSEYTYNFTYNFSLTKITEILTNHHLLLNISNFSFRVSFGV